MTRTEFVSYRTSNLWQKKLTCKIWGSHSGVAEDSCLLGRDAVSLDQQWPMLRRIVVPPCTGSGSASNIPEESSTPVRLHDPYNEGTVILRNFGSWSSDDTAASRPRRLERPKTDLLIAKWETVIHLWTFQSTYRTTCTTWFNPPPPKTLWPQSVFMFYVLLRIYCKCMSKQW